MQGFVIFIEWKKEGFTGFFLFVTPLYVYVKLTWEGEFAAVAADTYANLTDVLGETEWSDDSGKMCVLTDCRKQKEICFYWL